MARTRLAFFQGMGRRSESKPLKRGLLSFAVRSWERGRRKKRGYWCSEPDTNHTDTTTLGSFPENESLEAFNLILSLSLMIAQTFHVSYTAGIYRIGNLFTFPPRKAQSQNIDIASFPVLLEQSSWGPPISLSHILCDTQACAALLAGFDMSVPVPTPRSIKLRFGHPSHFDFVRDMKRRGARFRGQGTLELEELKWTTSVSVLGIYLYTIYLPSRLVGIYQGMLLGLRQADAGACRPERARARAKSSDIRKVLSSQPSVRLHYMIV